MRMNDDVTYRFDLPMQNQPIIKVVGVGGGGSNAVNNMYQRGIHGVSFVVCNTDSQALQISPVPNKLQIGADLTAGLGAGANPDVGRHAALESKESIRELLCDDTKMLFITAGMGGGTGTGAAPVIANIAHKLGILTVGIVTLPFSFEGTKKRVQAQQGIDELRKYCDTVLIILNDRLQAMLGSFSISKAFQEADNVLTTAAKSIAEIITVPGYINVDFEDVKTVMKDAGAAVMGSSEAEGEGRALQAAELALSSPLLDYADIRGAKKLLLSIVSGPEAELQMDELTAITNYIKEQTGDDVEMIFGHGADVAMGQRIKVTVIATGFSQGQVDANREMEHKKEIATGDSLDVDYSKKLYTKSVGQKSDFDHSMRMDILSEKQGRGGEQKGHYPLQLSLPFSNKPVPSVSIRDWDDHDFKVEIEIPTFVRKKIKLDDLSSVDHTTASELIRYTLDDV